MTAEAEIARTAAADAAEAVRTLNHATRHPGEFVVADVYTVTAELASIEDRLVQSARQLAAVLAARLEDGGLSHDKGGDVGDAVAAARELLGRAGELASQAGELFDQAQRAIAAVADHGTAAPR